jgi:hypothetical protein
MRRLGLPTTDDAGAIIGSIRGALDPDILEEYDSYAGSDDARLAFMFAEPKRALWLACGLRLPMMRRQLAWILERLSAHGVSQGDTVVDVGSGAGLTAATVARASSADVVALDPVPGSADAAMWVADQLATSLSVREQTLDQWEPEASSNGRIVIIAQAVLWYLNGDMPDRRHDPVLTLVQDPPAPGDGLRDFFQTCSQSDAVLITDHNWNDLWVMTVLGLSQQGLYPEWSTARVDTFDLPGMPDTQLSLAFTREASQDIDFARLRTMLAGARR